ncbi:dipeptide epimerase [Geomesophilobacter sediminis]|uniref:Dipeptide epimerase n=1 Tax=Geomesophilobacter sediminis TaxID=2798584 RepID=A0A8J7M157_9BACT|nr:dipeptide epimerase [Geomesophilobacter sediminis]MBJ6726709.1 dipeptide epimerase [Geomesophilobacter sediminis]
MEGKPFVIEDAVASIVRAPLASPFRIATGQHDELANVFLCLRSGDGICGYGEAAVATHITGETVEGTLANLQIAAHALRGSWVDNPKEVCKGFAHAFAGNHAGLAALEMAVLDLFARKQEVPLYQLFAPATGRQPQLSFDTDITIVIGTLDEARSGAKQFAARGFRKFKIKIGKDEDLDLMRILAVWQAAPGSELILDANMGFTADRMLAFLARLEKYQIRPALLEQPVPRTDWQGLAQITAKLAGSGILVCADESVGSLDDAKRAIESQAVSAINIKTMKSGFIEGVEIARLAAANGIRLMLGAMMESSLSITASAHFAAGLGCFDFMDLDTTFFLKGEPAHSPCLNERGHFDLAGAGPGIGVVAKF